MSVQHVHDSFAFVQAMWRKARLWPAVLMERGCLCLKTCGVWKQWPSSLEDRMAVDCKKLRCGQQMERGRGCLICLVQFLITLQTTLMEDSFSVGELISVWRENISLQLKVYWFILILHVLHRQCRQYIYLILIHCLFEYIYFLTGFTSTIFSKRMQRFEAAHNCWCKTPCFCVRKINLFQLHVNESVHYTLISY